MEPTHSRGKPLPSPPDTNQGATPSPWSLSSQTSSGHLTLALPADLTSSDTTETAPLCTRVSSPSDFLLERSAIPQLHMSKSHPQERQPQEDSFYARHQLGNTEQINDIDPFTDIVRETPLRSLKAVTSNDSNIMDLVDAPSPDTDIPSKKRKLSRTGPQLGKRKRHCNSDQNYKNHDWPVRREVDTPYEEEVEEVDLIDVDNDEGYGAYQSQRQEELIRHQRQEEAEKPVRLSDFQCIICLDNPTDLTVTWCGHLFCSVCLHEALHAGTQKKTCPVCRQTISARPGTKPKNGIFALSMKLMTAKKKGKQAAGRDRP